MMIDFKYLFQKYFINPTGIVHLGASYAQERDTYRELGVKNVIWVEAIPSVYEEMKKNIEGYEGNIALNACLSDADGKEVVFNISNNEHQSSSYLELGEHLRIHPEVKYIDSIKMKTKTVPTLFKENNITLSEGWLLNCDLQGAEGDVLMGMQGMLNKFDYLYLEVNVLETYKGCMLLDEMDRFLAYHGFERKETGQIVGGCWSDALWIRIKK